MFPHQIDWPHSQLSTIQHKVGCFLSLSLAYDYKGGGAPGAGGRSAFRRGGGGGISRAAVPDIVLAGGWGVPIPYGTTPTSVAAVNII